MSKINITDNHTKINNKNDNNNSIIVYRYKLSDEIMTIITEFAKIHKYDDRKTYKEEWKNWYQKNIDILNSEINRLYSIGYKGSIEDKMFKAGRYYFRKKNVSINNDIKLDESTQKKRRNYVSMNNSILDAMDEHILKIINNEDFSPANGYNLFCKENIEILRKEVNRIYQVNKLTTDEITEKIKKTYKNRYYLLSRSYNL